MHGCVAVVSAAGNQLTCDACKDLMNICAALGQMSCRSTISARRR